MKKHRRIVADDIPVPFFGIEPEREAAHVALGIGRAALTDNRGKTQERLGRLLADFGIEDFRLAVLLEMSCAIRQRAECA